MLRVRMSITAGRITPSRILRRLGAYSRMNKLYLACWELGGVIRTGLGPASRRVSGRLAGFRLLYSLDACLRDGRSIFLSRSRHRDSSLVQTEVILSGVLKRLGVRPRTPGKSRKRQQMPKGTRFSYNPRSHEPRTSQTI